MRAGRPTAQEREGEVSSILDGTIQTTRRDGSVVTDARVGTRPVQLVLRGSRSTDVLGGAGAPVRDSRVFVVLPWL